MYLQIKHKTTVTACVSEQVLVNLPNHGYLSTSFKTSFLQFVLVSTVAEHPLTNDQISFYSHHHSHEVFIMALLFWALRLDSSLHSCCEYTHCGKT